MTDCSSIMRKLQIYSTYIVILSVEFVKCTTDVNLEHLKYLANHLLESECKKLVALLYSTSYDIPSALSIAIKAIPDETCIKLLIKWNSGREKGEGATKTHVDIAHRLRQLKRNDLAEWLAKSIFRKLSNDVKGIPDTKFDSDLKENTKYRLSKDKIISNEDPWTYFDSILWIVLASLLVLTVITLCKLLYLCLTRPVAKQKIEEEVNLLNRDSIDSDQDTIYEYAVTCDNAGMKHLDNRKLH